MLLQLGAARATAWPATCSQPLPMFKERPMFFRRASALVLTFSLLGTPAFASDPASPAKASIEGSAAAASVPLDEQLVPESRGLAPIRIGANSRGAVLPLLYGSYAALQAFDAVSTLRGTQLGAQEANPMMAGLSRNPAGMWALKGGLTAASIVAAEHLW